jgi:hypothetical protein
MYPIDHWCVLDAVIGGSAVRGRAYVELFRILRAQWPFLPELNSGYVLSNAFHVELDRSVSKACPTQPHAS